MSQKMPLVPPDNRSRIPGAGEAPQADTAPDKRAEDRQRHLGEQGRQGNIKQNTTNQGYQQDR